MATAEALELITDIETPLDSGGWPDQEVLANIKQTLRRLRSAPGPPGLISEKIVAIEIWTEILFSTRRFERYGGADRVRLSILHECHALRQIVSTGLPPDNSD